MQWDAFGTAMKRKSGSAAADLMFVRTICDHSLMTTSQVDLASSVMLSDQGA